MEQKKTEGAKELPYSVCLLFSSAKRDAPFHSRLVLASELLCVLFSSLAKCRKTFNTERVVFPANFNWKGQVTVTPNVAVVGATGVVGEVMRQVLAERNFPFHSIKFLASERSAGKTIAFRAKDYQVEPLRPEAFAGVDLVLSSTPASISRRCRAPTCRGARWWHFVIRSRSASSPSSRCGSGCRGCRTARSAR